jgi:hypothetical protein
VDGINVVFSFYSNTACRNRIFFVQLLFLFLLRSAADNKRLQSSSSMEQLNTLSQGYSPRATYSTTIGESIEQRV